MVCTIEGGRLPVFILGGPLGACLYRDNLVSLLLKSYLVRPFSSFRMSLWPQVGRRKRLLGDMPDPQRSDRNRGGSWHDISWRRVHKEVQSLRYRVFRCSRTGNFKKLRGLQKLLIYSDANLLLSIRKVTQSRTSGVDGVTALTPAKRLNLFREIKSLGVLNWDPFPVNRYTYHQGSNCSGCYSLRLGTRVGVQVRGLFLWLPTWSSS